MRNRDEYLRAVANFKVFQADVMAPPGAPDMAPPDQPDQMSPEVEDPYPGLNDRQSEQVDMQCEIVDEYGPYDQSSGPDGAHYMDKNPFVSDGLACKFCVFWAGFNACDIVAGDISPNGVCKLWVIPDPNAPDPNEMDPQDAAKCKPKQTAMKKPKQRMSAAIDTVPPQSVRTEAERGLKWRREFNRGGTAVGVARARDLANGRQMSESTLRRMVSYFARHEVDRKGEGWSPGSGYPSAGRIAWALWGGDAGRAWAKKVVAEIDRSRAK